jgi:hypothetical protein
MGFEPTTPTLARLCSTPELHPHSKPPPALEFQVSRCSFANDLDHHMGCVVAFYCIACGLSSDVPTRRPNPLAAPVRGSH